MHFGRPHRRALRDLGDRLASEYEDVMDPDQVLAMVTHAHLETAPLNRFPPTCLALTESVARQLITDRVRSSGWTRA